MSLKIKLLDLQNNKEKLNAYRKAIDTLRIVGAEEILQLMALPTHVDVTHLRGTELAAAACHQSLGYQQCLSDVFGLERVSFTESDRPVPDFGANDKLGYSESEAKGLL